MNRFNIPLDSKTGSHDIASCIDSTKASSAMIVSIQRPPSLMLSEPNQETAKMESMILASYVLKSNQPKGATHPALDQTAHQSARSALSSIAASLVGIAAFALVLNLFG